MNEKIVKQFVCSIRCTMLGDLMLLSNYAWSSVRNH